MDMFNKQKMCILTQQYYDKMITILTRELIIFHTMACNVQNMASLIL